MIIVGIDPGQNTGFAVYINGELKILSTIEPLHLADAIRNARPSRVVYEDSRLTSFVFTTVKSRPAALKMARNIGQVDAWCSLIVAICDHLCIACHGISPKGKGAKLDAKQFASVTGWTGKSNQHERDGAMTAFPYRRSSNARP